MSAPSGRIISVSVMAKVTLTIETENSADTSANDEGEEKKIERIERPAEEAGEEGVALVAIQ